MAKLGDIAQQVMDLYYQNFPDNAAFFDLEDFKDHVATTYTDLLDTLFQLERKDRKANEGFANVEIPPQWTLPETLEVKFDKEKSKFFINTEWPIYAFKFDATAYALQPLVGLGNGCNNKPCRFRRITLYEAQFQNVTPPVSVVFYYLNSATEIVFLGAKEGAKVEAHYIPQIVGADDDCLLADSIVRTVIDACLERFFKSKNGNFVDKANDQNPNVVPQQQINPSLGK